MPEHDNEPFYVISVVAKMLDLHPQTIRHYDRLGLISPSRTAGKMRLFSKKDIERLEQIHSFTSVGVNLAGVEMLVNMMEKMVTMKQEMEEDMKKMQEELEAMHEHFYGE
ncbi:MAG: MerR family transcriptional regulator [Firmicutes bacterium]|nr:MerR family transcriptional regulator [Bacillota bacterium]